MRRGSRNDVWVRVHGRYWKLQDVPAADWIRAATSPDMAGIWPGLVADKDAEDLFGLWLTERSMQRRSTLVSQKALERASGREWRWALNLIKEINDSFTHMNGLLVREGVRADRTPLGDYLDAVYTLFSEKLKAEDFKAFETRLRKIPAGAVGLKPRMSSKSDLLAFAKD